MAEAKDRNTLPPPYMEEPKGYELSGKIMLSAIVILFAVVVIMVCLHIYARWYILRARRRQIRRARRRTHLVFYVEASNPANIIPVPTRGLDACVLKSLPTFVYKKEEGDNNEEVVECAVCLSEFEENEKGRLLPKCNHSFHVECIDMWFHSHSTCPICRSSVDADDDFPAVKNSGEIPARTEDVVVELAELTRGQPGPVSESTDQVGPSQPPVAGSSSFGGRRKGLDFVGVSIEVPRRSQSFSFNNSDESTPSPSPSQGFKSPTSRLLSLKRILSRDKKKSPLPSPSSGTGTSCSMTEFDAELGRVDGSTQLSHTLSLTPR